LKIGTPNDKYEQEADRVAEAVMRVPGPTVQRQVMEQDEEELLQTKSRGTRTSEVTSTLVTAPDVLRESGRPLDAEMRAFVEPRFGYDFSRVQVHTGAAAEESARTINARAYTAGQHIVFGAGAYRPETEEGRKLLAHELTHTIQQSSHPSPNSVVRCDDLAEAGVLQRSTLVKDSSTPPRVIAVEFTVGVDVSLSLATMAQPLAAGGVTDTKLRQLRREALSGDDTISDDERMFLAGLRDPANATTVAAARIAAGTKLTFSRASIEAHMAYVRDLDQQVLDPAIAVENRAAQQARAANDPMGSFLHESAALRATIIQMMALVGPSWMPKVTAAADYGTGRVSPQEILEAMLAAASDDTEGDRAMAAVVYVVAAVAGNAMAGPIRAGRIKIDEVPGLGSGGTLANYRATAGGGGAKGDTITVPGTFNINDVGHRSVIIHELAHAADDAAASPLRVGTLARDQQELAAYRAGARYQLEQTAPLTQPARFMAVKQIGALLNEISMLALVLESRTQPALFEPVIREANAFWATPLPEIEVTRLFRNYTAGQISAEALRLIRRAYGIVDPSGSEIPGANDLPVDALSGEGILDWIDRT
jgi:hypothetical protein